LIYKNLRLSANDKWAGVMLNCYKYQWSRNQLILSGTARRMKALSDCGIRFFLGGALPLVLGAYEDLGMRAIRHVDFVVPSARQTEAGNFLKEIFQSDKDAKKNVDAFSAQSNLSGAIGPLRTGAFWADAIPCTILGTNGHTIGSDDRMLNTLLSGRCQTELVTWFADVLFASSRTSWHLSKLQERARHCRVVTALKDNLTTILSLSRETQIDSEHLLALSELDTVTAPQLELLSSRIPFFGQLSAVASKFQINSRF
jgi:hypothetical protein